MTHVFIASDHLYVFSECPEDLLGHLESFEEVPSALNVDGVVVRVVPVEVGDALLQSKEVVDCADDNIHGGRVPRLSSEVVLKVSVVALTEQLEEPKETLREEMVGENFAENCGGEEEGGGHRIRWNSKILKFGKCRNFEILIISELPSPPDPMTGSDLLYLSYAFQSRTLQQ